MYREDFDDFTVNNPDASCPGCRFSLSEDWKLHYDVAVSSCCKRMMCLKCAKKPICVCCGESLTASYVMYAQRDIAVLSDPPSTRIVEEQHSPDVIELVKSIRTYQMNLMNQLHEMEYDYHRGCRSILDSPHLRPKLEEYERDIQVLKTRLDNVDEMFRMLCPNAVVPIFVKL